MPYFVLLLCALMMCCELRVVSCVFHRLKNSTQTHSHPVLTPLLEHKPLEYSLKSEITALDNDMFVKQKKFCLLIKSL